MPKRIPKENPKGDRRECRHPGTMKINKSLEVFPNPSGGIININIKSSISEKSRIEIYSLNGHKVYQRDFIKEPGNNHYSIDLKSASKGIYLVHVSSETGNYTQKIMLE